MLKKKLKTDYNHIIQNKNKRYLLNLRKIMDTKK